MAPVERSGSAATVPGRPARGTHGPLQETLHLEPVVGHLPRRAVRPTTLAGDGQVVELAAGDLVDLDVRAANADARSVGERGPELCPDRGVSLGIPPSAMSLGGTTGAPVAPSR